MERRYQNSGIHPCTINVQSCWPRLTPRANVLQRVLRWLRQLTMPSYYHPQTKYMFKSMYTFRQEKTRMIYHCSAFVIHPFSALIVYFEVFAFFFCYIYFVMEIFRLYFGLYLSYSGIVICMRVLHMLLITTRFLVGYVDTVNEETFIVLDLKKIAWRYLKSYLILDILEFARLFLSQIPHETAVIWLNLVIFHVYFALIVINKISSYMRMTLRILFGMEQRYHGFVSFVILVLLVTHYNTCLLYGMPRMISIMMGEYDPKHILRKKLTSDELINKYLKNLHKILLFFYKSSPFHRKTTLRHHMKVQCFINVTMFFLHIYIVVYMLLAIKNMNHAGIKYGFMWTNVLNFLQSRNIGGKLKYKILAHYQYKFQNKYFDEAFIIKSLSRHLQYENQLHTCSHLVANVSLLRGLPKMVIGRVIAELQPIVFLPNDIITKWQTNFDCIYFISYGTVAMFNSTGRELSHLEDGGIIGAVGYYAGINYLTITSVTITELYKWHIKDINETALLCPELSHRIKVLGRTRIVRMVSEEKQNERSLNPVLKKLGLEGKQLRYFDTTPDVVSGGINLQRSPHASPHGSAGSV